MRIGEYRHVAQCFALPKMNDTQHHALIRQVALIVAAAHRMEETIKGPLTQCQETLECKTFFPKAV
jgi:hypothetical protein